LRGRNRVHDIAIEGSRAMFVSFAFV